MTQISQTIFRNFLATPLQFDSWLCYYGHYPKTNQDTTGTDDSNYKPIIKGYNFTSDYFQYNNSFETRPYFVGCGDIIITGCTFLQLTNSRSDFTDVGGGGLFVKQYCSIIMHNCHFNNCHSSNDGSGALICRSRNNVNSYRIDMDEKPTKETDIQYCCFQECYATQEGYFGAALFIASETTTLLYTSAVDCYMKDTTHNMYGAQIDINSPNSIHSNNLNISGGRSIQCSGIEYRNIKAGTFKFQTIENLYGRFMTSFTGINQGENLDISYCNYYKSTIWKKQSDNDLNSAIVHSRKASITLSHFYIIDTTFEADDCFIFSINDGTIFADFCYSNMNIGSDQSFRVNAATLGNNNQFYLNSMTTYKIDQLGGIGACDGEKTAEPIIITSIFTPSFFFSRSESFSPSTSFSNSMSFIETSSFTQSEMFSPSKDFTQSTCFTKSVEFSDSVSFTLSSGFSNSISFTNSDSFSHSMSFSSSTDFSNSINFTNSERFNCSNKFSDSSKFTNSVGFADSSIFSRSNSFTNSFKFSPSNNFIPSTVYSQSIVFTDSEEFLKTSRFSSSSGFSISNSFSESILFTTSDKFSISERFSDSMQFTDSSHMPDTSIFSGSSLFSSSIGFTKSSSFTNSFIFSVSNELPNKITSSFEPSSNFTNSDYFLEQIIIEEPFVSASNESSKRAKIAVIVAGVSSCALVLIIAAVIISRRHSKVDMDFAVNEVTVVPENETIPQIMENPIFELMHNENDDPFKDDFIENEVFYAL